MHGIVFSVNYQLQTINTLFFVNTLYSRKLMLKFFKFFFCPPLFCKTARASKLLLKVNERHFYARIFSSSRSHKSKDTNSVETCETTPSCLMLKKKIFSQMSRDCLTYRYRKMSFFISVNSLLKSMHRVHHFTLQKYFVSCKSK